MPFYEYQCKNCGHALEAMQKISEPPLKKCPECGKSQLTRLMSAPVFRLKGAGWYETDFKGDQDNKKNLADRPEAEAAKDEKAPATDAKADVTAKDATAKDATGKDGAGKDSAGKDGAVKDAAKPADKAAGKSKEKAAPAESAKKPAVAGISKRGAAPARPTSKPTKAVKKPAAKAKKRR